MQLNLKFKLIIIFLAIGFIPLSVIGVISYVTFKKCVDHPGYRTNDRNKGRKKDPIAGFLQTK